MATSALQFENDDLMRPDYGDDYGISCCVSAMRLGKDMQFFGARCNLPKLLLLALNGGRDELTGAQIGPESPPYEGEYLEMEAVAARFHDMRQWLARLYVNTLNIIHHMHDKYAYERLMMALHDTEPHRSMAFGIAGLSVVADAFSAIRHARVRPLRDARGLIVDYAIEGDFPRFGTTTTGWTASRPPWWKTSLRAASAQDLPERDAHALHPDHHLQCGVRKENRRHPRRTQGGRAVRPRCQPHARPGQRRRAGHPQLPCQAAVFRLP
jgi:hypothetical protein